MDKTFRRQVAIFVGELKSLLKQIKGFHGDLERMIIGVNNPHI